MRCPAQPSACTEAPWLLTVAAGRGLGGRGRGSGSCSGHPSGASSVASAALERSPARRSAASVRSSARRVLSSGRAIAALERSSLERWATRAWAMLCAARWVGSAFCLDGLFGRDRGRCPRRGARLTCLLRCGLGAPQGFVRRRDRRASVDERTAVAETRSAARRRRALCTHEVRVVEVPDRGPARLCSSSVCQGGRTRRFPGAQVTQRGGAWSGHWGPVGTG